MLEKALFMLDGEKAFCMLYVREGVMYAREGVVYARRREGVLYAIRKARLRLD
jgi:hypothetical protein